MICTLFGRGTVYVCAAVYRHSMCSPFVTRQTSILRSVSRHTHSSMSAVTETAASKMRCFNSSSSLGKDGKYTKSLIRPHKNKSHGVRSGDLGASSSKESPLVRLQQSRCLADAHLNVHAWLYESGEVPQMLSKWHTCIHEQTQCCSYKHSVLLSRKGSRLIIKTADEERKQSQGPVCPVFFLFHHEPSPVL